MPWKIDAIPEQIKALPQGAQKVWIAVANQGLEDGKSEEDAIKGAWGAVKKQWRQDDGGRWIRNIEASEFIYVELADPGDGKPVEFLRVGQFRDMHGQSIKVTPNYMAELVANFEAGAAGQDVPIDIDHEKGEAAGWVKKIWQEGEKLLAQIKWNARGIQLVGEKVYRYLSATIAVDKPVLRSISLVNFPAVKGLSPVELSEGVYALQAETNHYSQGQAPGGIDGGFPADSADDIGNKNLKKERSKNMELIKEIRTKLNLSESDDIKAKLDELMVKAEKPSSIDLAEYEAMKTRVNKLAEQIRIKDRDTLVDQAFSEGKLVPAQREWALAEAYERPESFRAYLKATPKVIDLKEHGSAGGRGEGKEGEVNLSEIELTEEEVRVAKSLGLNLDMVRKSKSGVQNDRIIG